MDVKAAINKRRAYRALQPVEITKDIIDSLSNAASLSPSCFNNQPWRYIFIYEPEILKKMFSALSTGNQSWATRASMIIVAFAQKSDDCVLKEVKMEREYYLFDVGLATAFIILQATELGLVAHPIAGYKPEIVHNILSIPTNYNIINLLIVGQKSASLDHLSEDQRKREIKRPTRIPINGIVFHNQFSEK